MLPYIDGMYSVYYTAGRIARKISRPAAGRIDTALVKGSARHKKGLNFGQFSIKLHV